MPRQTVKVEPVPGLVWMTTAPRASRHAPVGAPAQPAKFNLLPRRMPSADEVVNNVRARSATLRAGIKLAA